MGRVLESELKEFLGTSLLVTYQNFGSALANPAIKVSFSNTSNVDAYISKDGTNKWARIPSFGTLTFDESTLYIVGGDQEYYFPKGTQLRVAWVSGVGASGSIIATVITRVIPL